MTRQKLIRKTTRIVGLCSIANFINAADRVILPIAIVPMTREFGWSLQLQGWILSSFAFGYFTSQIIGACVTNRFGGKVVLFYSVLLWSISTFITPFLVHSVPSLIFCRVLLGLGEGLGLPTIFHIFANQIPIEERSRSFSYLVASGSIGQTIAAVICPHMSWQMSFWIFGTLGLLWIPAWLLLYSDNAPSLGREEIPLFTPKITNLSVRWSEFVCHWSLWAIYIAHFSMNWSNYIVMQWLPTYLHGNLGANKEDISFTAIPYIINSLFNVVAGHFADTLVNRRWTVLSVRRLMTGIGLMGPGIFLLIFSTVDNLLAAVLFVSISMAFCAFNSAGHLSNHADIAPNHAGITFAVSNTLATIPGILCGPFNAELVTASHGRWFPVFVLAATINFTGAMIYYSQSSASQIL